MGKAARLKRARGAVPPPPRSGAPPNRTVLWFSAAGPVLLVVVLVFVFLGMHKSAKVPPPAPLTAADRNAPAALVAAANAVNFKPTTEAGVGALENEPASVAKASTNPYLLPVGATAPGFTLKTPQGSPVGLASLRGKAVLLEFFATWCPHCNAESPHLRQLYASLPKSRYAFVSVVADSETAPSVFAFHRYYGLAYPALLDPSSQPGSYSHPGGEGAVSRTYGVVAFPTFYVLDRRGRIVWRSDGEQPDALLRQELQRAARA